VQIRAAVLWKQGDPLSVEAVELSPPESGEVLVDVQAAGVCHSDLHATSGDWPMRVPLVPGHEGAGIVRGIGAGVSAVNEGDHVVFCWAPACGACTPCREGTPLLCDRLDRTTFRNRLPGGGTRLTARGQNVAPFLGTACFATHAVVPQEALVVVPRDVPFESLAAVGCAVVTGVGAITNAAKAVAGTSVAVIGVGGVGLNVVQGGRLAGCTRIIAIDRHETPLAIAVTMGATDVLRADGHVADLVRTLTGRGADYVVDTVGTPETLADAIAATRKGGTIILTGLSRLDSQGSIPMFSFVMHEKRLVGSVYGSGRPLHDIARLVSLYRDGHLKLQELATRTYRLEQINEALTALARGEGGRGIVTFERSR